MIIVMYCDVIHKVELFQMIEFQSVMIMWIPTEWVVGKESVTGLTQFLYPDVT